VIELFGPEHAGEGLAHDGAGVDGKLARGDGGVEIVGFVTALE
jgi:hypothetical protein